MPSDFNTLHAVVTGGTGALGSAVVSQLLDAGARVHIPVFHLKELERCLFKDDARVRLAPGVDLRSDESVEGFYRDVPALFASIHIAGGFGMAGIADTRGGQASDLMEMNALTAFNCCREAVKRIRSSGARPARGPVGTIVNVGARPGASPTLGGGMVAYTMSKAAVGALTQSLAEEVRAEGIWVNAVLPSIIDTAANRAAMPGADHSKWPTPAEIAAAILRLASPANALTSGALVPVFGRA
jgi:NAD(P)-dependent dehydrogenase (short-subunit alcohol dehydrogenase family)